MMQTITISGHGIVACRGCLTRCVTQARSDTYKRRKITYQTHESRTAWDYRYLGSPSLLIAHVPRISERNPARSSTRASRSNQTRALHATNHVRRPHAESWSPSKSRGALQAPLQHALKRINRNSVDIELGHEHSEIRQYLRSLELPQTTDPQFEHSVSTEAALDDGAMNNLTKLDADQGSIHLPVDMDVLDDEDLSVAHLDQEQGNDTHRSGLELLFLERGDLVQLVSVAMNQAPIIAVFVRQIGEVRTSGQFLTSTGQMMLGPERLAQHTIPGFVSADELDAILPYLPAEQGIYPNVPRNVAAPVLSKMNKFISQSNELYRSNAARFDGAHDLLSHATDLRSMTLREAAAELLRIDQASLTRLQLFTTNLAIHAAGFAFGTDNSSYRITGIIRVRPRAQVVNTQMVQTWMRQWQEYTAVTSNDNKSTPGSAGPGAAIIEKFIAKAKSLIAESRKTREFVGEGMIGPSREKQFNIDGGIKRVAGQTFDNHDKHLIRYFESYALSRSFRYAPQLTSLIPLILHATGMYDGHALNGSMATAFLQEMGVITSFENRIRFDEELFIPGTVQSKPLAQMVTSVQKLQNDYQLVDNMKDLRHDWGNMPVYCIDGIGAHELDDGVSIEPQATDGTTWVHIHIANPTAFIDVDSPIAALAQHMTETVYFPERAYMMLPRWLSQQHFSLGRDRPCLTFSARLDDKSQIIQTKITPGIVRNVHRVAVENLDDIIGLRSRNRARLRTFKVGTSAQPKSTAAITSSSQLPAKDISNLQSLHKISVARLADRQKKGGTVHTIETPSVNVWESSTRSGLGFMPPSRSASLTTLGDPCIEYKSRDLDVLRSPTDYLDECNLVQEMMLLACNIAALWSAERGVPVLYRGTVPRGLQKAGARQDFVQELLNMDSGTKLPMHEVMRSIEHSQSTMSVEPVFHDVLNLTHVTRVTSPLRRYADMLVHWNIEAQLRHEASLSKPSSTTSTLKAQFPISKTALDGMIVNLRSRERTIAGSKKKALIIWTTQLLFRAFHFNECELPKTFSAYFTVDAKEQYLPSVYLREYALRAVVEAVPGWNLTEIKAGQWLEVEISRIDVFNSRIWVRPLRLLDNHLDI